MLKRLLIAFVLCNILLSAPYIFSWHGDEGVVQLVAYGDEVDLNGLDGASALFYTLFPNSPMVVVFDPARGVQPYNPIRVTYSPKSRAPPALTLS